MRTNEEKTKLKMNKHRLNELLFPKPTFHTQVYREV